MPLPCPRCKSADNVFQDHAGATCRMCGTVLPQKFIDSGSDWRNFESDAQNGVQKNQRASELDGSKKDRFNLVATGDAYDSFGGTCIGGGGESADYYANIMAKVEQSVQLLANKNSLHELTNEGIREKVKRETGRSAFGEADGDSEEESSEQSSDGEMGSDEAANGGEKESSETAKTPTAVPPEAVLNGKEQKGGSSSSAPKRVRKPKNDKLRSEFLSTANAQTSKSTIKRGAKTLILYADQLREYRAQVKEFKKICKKASKEKTLTELPKIADHFDKTALITQLGVELDAQAGEILRQSGRRQTCTVSNLKINCLEKVCKVLNLNQTVLHTAVAVLRDICRLCSQIVCVPAPQQIVAWRIVKLQRQTPEFLGAVLFAACKAEGNGCSLAQIVHGFEKAYETHATGEDGDAMFELSLSANNSHYIRKFRLANFRRSFGMLFRNTHEVMMEYKNKNLKSLKTPNAPTSSAPAPQLPPIASASKAKGSTSQATSTQPKTTLMEKNDPLDSFLIALCQQIPLVKNRDKATTYLHVANSDANRIYGVAKNISSALPAEEKERQESAAELRGLRMEVERLSRILLESARSYGGDDGKREPIVLSFHKQSKARELAVGCVIVAGYVLGGVTLGTAEKAKEFREELKHCLENVLPGENVGSFICPWLSKNLKELLGLSTGSEGCSALKNFFFPVKEHFSQMTNSLIAQTKNTSDDPSAKRRRVDDLARFEVREAGVSELKDLFVCAGVEMIAQLRVAKQNF